MSDLLERLDSLPPAYDIWRSLGGGYRKDLGQHFIFDGRLTDELGSLVGLDGAAALLEIGSGAGSLTRVLLRRLLVLGLDIPFYVVEPDSRCLSALVPLCDIVGERLHIRSGFAEREDFGLYLPAGTAVFGNLPYNSASAILLHLLEHLGLFTSMTLMFQSEVASRLCALPGSRDYGRLSVSVQFLCSCELLLSLPSEAFVPAPRVSSSVVRLVSLGLVRRSSWVSLQDVLRVVFSERRKMLRVSLRRLVRDSEALLSGSEIDGRRRAETLTTEEFDRLALCYERGIGS